MFEFHAKISIVHVLVEPYNQGVSSLKKVCITPLVFTTEDYQANENVPNSSHAIEYD